ncbi:hypothetical protein MUB15_20550 [Priestia sp. OVS21]|nr:hypothetical protein [Priestia sp. OVS21]
MIEKSLNRREAEKISGISGGEFSEITNEFKEFIITMEVKSNLSTYYPYYIVTLLREIKYLRHKGMSDDEIKVTLRQRITSR